MTAATQAIYETVVAAPGKFDAVDVILAVRSAQLAEPTIRRGIWQLLSDGILDLDTNLHLVTTSVKPA